MIAVVYEMLLHVHGTFTLKLKTLTGISCNKVDVWIDFGTLQAWILESR